MKRKSLADHIRDLSPAAPLRVIIGAGDQAWDGWFPTGRDDLDLTRDDDWTLFQARPADGFLCEHVWEHLTEDEGRAAAARVFGALRPGGRLRVAVPDGHVRNAAYRKMIQVGGPGPADHPAADHKTVYTVDRFVDLFRSAGFDVDPLEYCDANGRLHYHQWDWSDGPIYRSLLSDHRNSAAAIGFTSIILDAKRP